MQPGDGVADPFCGTKSYEGHKGTDIRVLSMADVGRDVSVRALGKGRVLRTRDEMSDRLAQSEADRARLAGQDCGNGVVAELSDGTEVQYCHLKRGSIRVGPGDPIAAGDVIGAVGASGNAEFPHVEIILRRNGEVIDPTSGRPLDAGCVEDASQSGSLWSQEAAAWMKAADRSILALGIAGHVPQYETFVTDGPPPSAVPGDPVTVGWGWFANLAAGDRIHIVISAPDGSVFSESMSDPLDRAKAAYMQFTGRKRAPVAGRYGLRIEVMRDGQAVASREALVEIGEN
nr:M23 family metallopeptidase [Jiella sp. LLJ827]